MREVRLSIWIADNRDDPMESHEDLAMRVRDELHDAVGASGPVAWINAESVTARDNMEVVWEAE